MRFYTQQHQFYCGVDLHARSLYVCILDHGGNVLVHQNLSASPEAFLQVIAPYREDLAVAAECMFAWYWLADLCAREGMPFVLGHALYMKAIHGGKAKNDKIDAHKIAALLRGGLIPIAYVYPARMRATRDLLRRRMHLMRKRAELLTHIQNTTSQYNLPAFEKRIAYRSNRAGLPEHFAHPVVRKSIEVDLALIEHYDRLLKDLELYLLRTARQHDPNTLYRLRTVPGIGKILSLVILYEIHDIHRFPTVQDFASYRWVSRSRGEPPPAPSGFHEEAAVNLDKCLVQAPPGTGRETSTAGLISRLGRHISAGPSEPREDDLYLLTGGGLISVSPLTRIGKTNASNLSQCAVTL